MDTDLLKTALQVAQCGSLAEAARRLEMDPSNVSRSLATLETRLGIRLFQRTTRRLSITEEGAAYLGRIAPVLEELDQALDDARDLRQQPQGRLRLTASVAFGTECIVPLLPKFETDLPSIEMDLVFSDTNLDLVAEGLDLAIRLTPAPTGDWISRKLRKTRYLLCASPQWLAQNPCATPQDIPQHDMLRLSLLDHRETWQFRPHGVVQDAPKNGPVEQITIKGRTTISNPLALRQAAILGLGPALLADWLAERALASGELVQVLPDYQVAASSFDTGAYLLYSSRQYLPSKTRAAIDFFSQHLA
ncbi:MAG: LysR family transcriptional regulator [Thalassovita sp.]